MDASNVTPEQTLKHMRLPGTNIYILGCLENRRITMGSQQVRAVNLIHALATTHFTEWRNRPIKPIYEWRERILVVGGSAGGLTAAAYAAFRGASVTLCESEDQLMPNLRNSERLLHPRLYEWGAPQPFQINDTKDYWKEARLGLPLLDWESGPANEVRNGLLAEWKSWADLYNIDTRRSVRINSLERKGNHWCYNGENFQHIILAVGFGQEKSPEKPNWAESINSTYWTSNSISSATGNILVCGNGDGALTDLFHALIHNFAQPLLIGLLEYIDPDRIIEDQVREIETELEKGRNSAEAPHDSHALIKMARRYLRLRTRKLDTWMRDNIRPDVNAGITKAWLMVRPRLGRKRESAFNPRTFPLNRLILSSLLRTLRCKTHLRLRYLEAEELPAAAPEKGLFHIVFRGGSVQPGPISQLLPNHHEELRHLAMINNDPKAGDITRRPLYPWFGEVTSPRKRRVKDALVRGADGLAIEVYRDVATFACVSEAFDSVFQAAALSSFSESDAKHYFLGVMRFYIMSFDEIIMSDTQTWDGSFMIRLPSIWRTLESEEQALFRRKIVISERPREGFQTAPDAIYTETVRGKRIPRAFLSSILGVSASAAYSAWCHSDAPRIDWTLENSNAVGILSHFAGERTEFAEKINGMLDAWKQFHGLVTSAQIRTRVWPSWTSTRAWNILPQFENPALFHKALSPAGKAVAKRVLQEYREGKLRSLIKMGLNRHIEEMRASAGDRKVLGELFEIQDWSDRAYNRMVAKQQGGNVFSCLRAGDAPGRIESGQNRKLRSGPLSIARLGQLQSADFCKLYEEWQVKRVHMESETGDSAKPITERFWLSFFDCLSSGLGRVAGNVEPKVISSDELTDWRVVDKMRKYSSIESFRIGWIGDLEEGSPNEGTGRTVKTEEGEGPGDDRPDESETEIMARNPWRPA